MKLPRTYILIVLICSTFAVIAQTSTNNIITEQTLKSISVDSAHTLFKKYGTVQNIETGFEVAMKLSQNKQDSAAIEKGVNLVAVLATVFAQKVEKDSLDLNDDKVVALLQRFEDEKYYIQRPKIHPFIKLMTYSCQKEYAYVHKTLLTTLYYKLLLVFLFIYIFIFMLTFSSKWNWRYKTHLRRFSYLAFLLVILVFVFFSITCKNNIRDHSFYGVQII